MRVQTDRFAYNAPVHAYILDNDNRPVPADLEEWARWLEHNNRHVGFTQITSQIDVSTVFMGIDHRHFGDGPPLLFETMIFGGPLDGATWRYVSWDDALVGHKAAVRKARAAIGQKVTEQS
jgi:hypothetical protein